MTIKVIAWPPVRASARSWTIAQPVARIRSALTGRDQMQASQRPRRMVEMTVSAKAGGLLAPGYMEGLIGLLDGGVNAVRLTSWRPYWQLSDAQFGDAAFWRPTISATVVTSGGVSAFRATGLPPGYPVARPGDRISVAGSVWQVINLATVNDAGSVDIKVLGEPLAGGPVTFDAWESRVFRPEALPIGIQTAGADWSYSWSFREVFADEVGGFSEVDPWT
ncbi:hypothetical protein GCM10011452_09160 [Gemmobacter lanyuensis]|uniref:Uncharacterized protein n=1 Tax=Gemmobacter lanyuensis TaxID=1054497 RepID=A0A918MIC3_9RHOB|nr:hypothetical protein [Gemmobacter lanyuensis]GGW23960.1 hypothetical protein GCM10011452_09160 [Gemmobacter lanyuensis]